MIGRLIKPGNPEIAALLRCWIRPAVIIVAPEASSTVVSDLRRVKPGTEVF